MNNLIEDNLRPLPIKGSDFFVVFLLFIIAVFVSNSFANLLSKFIQSDILISFITAFLMQFLFLIYALYVNGHFSLKLFSFTKSFGEVVKVSIKSFAIILPLVFLTMLIWSSTLMLFGIDIKNQDSVDLWANSSTILEYSLGAFSIIILAPIAEELIFRGILYRCLKLRYTAFISALISAVIFSLIHFSVLAFVPLAIFAFMLCVAYEKYCDIRVNILIHLYFNTLNLIMIKFVI